MERILLIEDDQALGRGTALALAGEGREIRVAATLAQGCLLYTSADGR